MGAGKGLAIAGVAIVAFIVIAYVIVPSVQMPNSINLQWEVYGLKDGQRVTPPLAFVSQGVEIDSLGAACSWSAQGESVDWDSLFIDGEFVIYLLAYMGEKTDITPENLGFQRRGPTAKDDGTSFSLTLDSLVLGRPYTSSDSTGLYWEVRIALHVRGTINEDVGSGVISDTIDDYVDYKIYWQDGTFVLTGGIV